ncbi:MAG TPA: hypothetical protein VHO70_24025 [Chitinispirillaceae bacterium]|nr:hypothetical protein [Chitinispirillaceae bacterium]
MHDAPVMQKHASTVIVQGYSMTATGICNVRRWYFSGRINQLQMDTLLQRLLSDTETSVVDGMLSAVRKRNNRCKWYFGHKHTVLHGVHAHCTSIDDVLQNN